MLVRDIPLYLHATTTINAKVDYTLKTSTSTTRHSAVSSGTGRTLLAAQDSDAYAQIDFMCLYNPGIVDAAVDLAWGTVDSSVVIVVLSVPAGKTRVYFSGVSWSVAGESGSGISGLVGINQGGTGANTAEGARTALGLEIGTDVQAWDADLSAISSLAALTGFLKKNAANVWVLDPSQYITGNQLITFSGDITGSGTTDVILTMNPSGATAGTYKSVTVNTKGLITAGTNPSTLTGYGITDALSSSQLDTDGTLAANSDSKIASQKAVKTYVAAYLAAQDAMTFKGVIDCSASPNYPAADAGNTYRVSVAGKIGGASGATVEIGDTLMCTVDGSTAGTQAAVGANWGILQTNIDGAVVGPSSATDGQLALFSGTSGKLIKAVTSSGDVTYSSEGEASVGKIGGYSITLTGTVTLSGGYSFAATLTGNTAVTFPTSGTLATADTVQTISGAKTITATPTFSNSTYSALFTGGGVGIGITAPQQALAVHSSGHIQMRLGNQAGNYYFDIGRNNVTGALTIQGNQANYNNINLGPDGGNVAIGTASAAERLVVGGNICHSADNAYSFGTATYRASAVYAVTGTINTSWSKQKTNVRKMSEAEQACFLEIGANACVYQWIDAVAAKGADKARLHVGYIADDAVTFDAVLSVKAICEKHGIDFDRWGFGCKDPNKITVTKTRTITQQKMVKKTRTVEVIVAASDGTQTVTYTDETYDDPVWVTDESGADVWFDLTDASGAVLKSSDGTPRKYRKPVQVTVEETYTEDEVETDANGNVVYRYGLRYTELREAIAVAEHNVLAALSVRVAALENKGTAV